MNANNNYLSALVNAGADAHSNLFNVVIDDKLIDKDLSQILSTHITNFTLPHFGIDMGNKIHYKTVSMSAPTATITGKKELTLEFRLDGAYQIYAYLLKARNRQCQPNLGKATTAVDDSMKITVTALADNISTSALDPTSETGYKKIAEYRYCWVKNINIDAYSYDGSRPMKVTATIGFWEFDEMEV